MDDEPKIKFIDPLEPPDLEAFEGGFIRRETLTREELERRYPKPRSPRRGR